GELLPPWNWVPLVGLGKMPAFSSACALASSRPVVIALPLNGTCNAGSGAPAVQPLSAWPAAANRLCWLGDRRHEAGACSLARLSPTPLKSPPYVFAKGTV